MQLHAYGDEIALWVASGRTHKATSLQLRNPREPGYSVRSVCRYCSNEGIHYRSGLTDLQLDRLVSSQIQAVEHSYGRQTLHGLLASQGLHVSQCRLSACMSRVAPGPQRQRTHSACRHLNPPMYNARFFWR